MENILKGKHIVLGVCGGIAAYKSVELLRLMKKQEAEVRVIMTRNAGWFVGQMTFEALSGLPVCSDMFEEGQDASIKHIDWAEQADAAVIAPATANMIGKLAGGIADDFLSTFMLAVTAPVLVCPSMNSNMYDSRPMRRNLEVLRQDGYRVLSPGAGELACGTCGPGRLPEAAEILDRLTAALSPKDLKGRRVLVTAGPTREPIDPVRYVSNPSSGKMGYAVARAAEYRGAEVVLVAGPNHLSAPLNVTVVPVNTAREMAQAVFDHMEDTHIVIKTAAVSDYRPAAAAPQKIKKTDDEMVLRMVKNQDILKELGRRKKGHILVGFAAETEALENNASKKLSQKNLDIIAGNLVDHPAYGFGSDDNKMTLFYRDGSREAVPAMTKEALAHELLDRVVGRFLTADG